MDLEKVRKEIDSVDDQIADLFQKRMKLMDDVVKAKKESKTAVNDPNRERNILLRVSEKVDEDKQIYLKRVFESLFEVSKAYQTVNMCENSKITQQIDYALSKGMQKFPLKAKVACQGVAGAYSGIATDRMFELADITYFKNFEGVFGAVEKGFCKYGVLPIENSYAGSVNQVYDLMKEHKFYIVRSIRLPVSHNLVVNKGAKKEEITEKIQFQENEK